MGALDRPQPGFPESPDLFDEHFICFLGKGVVLRCQWGNTGVFASSKISVESLALHTTRGCDWRSPNLQEMSGIESKRNHGVTCTEMTHCYSIFQCPLPSKMLEQASAMFNFCRFCGASCIAVSYECEQTEETLIHSRGSCALYKGCEAE